MAGDRSAPSLWQVGIWALTGLARCVPQLAAQGHRTAVATARRRRKKHATAMSSDREKKMRAAGSRATAFETLVLVTRKNLLPACVQATPEEKRCGRHMHRPPCIGGRSSASLEQALTGGCCHPGRFMRDASDRLGGSPVVHGQITRFGMRQALFMLLGAQII